MKVTAQQQLEIRRHLAGIVIVQDTLDELYDHVLTALEHQEGDRFEISSVENLVNTEFGTMINTAAEKKNHQRLNHLFGVLLFAVALLTYWLTMEPTVSFWDCGEFIATANKLQVGHQPGAPLFLMIGKMFSLLALGDTARIAYWINFSAVLASAGTIMFLFWTITALGAKLFSREKIKTRSVSIIAAGVIGALAYTFSDTFWFSAVEAEVYALSSLFTAITFWAILKWESQGNDKWLLFIAFIVGLSIGVHLLSLLVIPAVALVYYFKKAKEVSLAGTLKAFAAGILIVGLVQFAVIQYFVLFAAKTDLFFVNGLGLPFGSGAIAFVIGIGGVITWAVAYSIRTKKYKLNLSLLCLVFILFGFSSYFMIIIRANAKPAINLSNPDNAFSLYSYLGRTNYGSTPLSYGNTFDATLLENKETGDTYRKGKSGYEVSGKTYDSKYDKNLLFPRTYSRDVDHVNFYKDWLNLRDGESPSFVKNMQFFTSWQMGFMYWRYFLWNFAGRQNDNQGQGDLQNGNWLSGIKILDTMRLGNQTDLPLSITANEGYNVYYSFPLLLGIAGLCWLYRKNKQTALIVLTLFFFTGIAIILYLNQHPLQVRERDYAYTGSFYAFAICIGFGVLALKDVLNRIAGNKMSVYSAAVVTFLAVPLLMAIQGWGDHNRSGKTTAAAWAKNYLNSCAPNAILFTNADNDTFPLWYAQEVEGFRTDVRVICIQFLSDDAYLNQLKKQLNRSAPLPLSMREEKYVAGVRDYFPYVDYGIKDSVELKDLLAVLTSDHQEDQVQMADGSFMNFLPTRKFRLTINAEQLIKTGTINPAEKEMVTPAMEWNFTKAYAGKGDLAMIDILATNNWERPVYYATTVSDDTYMGLDKYLYLEGYAYRLLPFKTNGDDRDKTSKTHSDVMYANVMNKLDFSAFRKAKYLDPESRRIVNGTWDLNNTLAANLLLEGKPVQSARVMEKSMKDLPMKNYSIRDTLNRMYTTENLYGLNRINSANKLAKETNDFLLQEMDYISTLTPELQQARMQEIRLALYVWSTLDKMTATYDQKELNGVIKGNFNRMMNTFGVRS